jgi:hypothetical protein
MISPLSPTYKDFSPFFTTLFWAGSGQSWLFEMEAAKVP